MTSAGLHIWKAAAASWTGAAHEAAGAGNQDAYATLNVDDVTAVAVADGHGHPAHFRSRYGAQLAVDLAVSLTSKTALNVDGPQALSEGLHEQVKPQLIRGWRQNVLDHAASVPFSEDATEKLLEPGDEGIFRTYGTTLIAIVGTPVAVGFVQIGDGDAIAVFGDGEVSRPLPEDSSLDGIHTTSLCQADAGKWLRVAVLDLSQRDLRLALAVTDGFAAPQVDGVGWWWHVGVDLGTHLQERGSAWIREQLPGWLSVPAQTGGDDTTMALLLNQGIEASGPMVSTDPVPA